MKTKVCTGCKKELPIEAFRPKTIGKPYLRSQCMPCLQLYKRPAQAKPVFAVDDLLTGWVMRHARMPRKSLTKNKKLPKITGYPLAGIHEPKQAKDEAEIVWYWAEEMTVRKHALYGHPTGVSYGG